MDGWRDENLCQCLVAMQHPRRVVFYNHTISLAPRNTLLALQSLASSSAHDHITDLD
jgi:hypothetical protein